ncbi:hypothetical protein C7S16_7030 [Burkholderia thailandensis]|uniref:Uncharacterized protein n=1 Tax=Burkholderia thailandensis TaxID=57975 RepID=A0AAW9CJP6_BURTH|nr:hypothetical protein [Burkholderia thailandensis]MDW9250814.1 hypothetical protein [Burkholderia thailandensis]
MRYAGTTPRSPLPTRRPLICPRPRFSMNEIAPLEIGGLTFDD